MSVRQRVKQADHILYKQTITTNYYPKNFNHTQIPVLLGPILSCNPLLFPFLSYCSLLNYDGGGGSVDCALQKCSTTIIMMHA